MFIFSEKNHLRFNELVIVTIEFNQISYLPMIASIINGLELFSIFKIFF